VPDKVDRQIEEEGKKMGMQQTNQCYFQILRGCRNPKKEDLEGIERTDLV